MSYYDKRARRNAHAGVSTATARKLSLEEERGRIDGWRERPLCLGAAERPEDRSRVFRISIRHLEAACKIDGNTIIRGDALSVNAAELYAIATSGPYEHGISRAPITFVRVYMEKRREERESSELRGKTEENGNSER